MVRNLFVTALLSTLVSSAALKRDSGASWKPAQGGSWQIILSDNLDVSRGLNPSDAEVWDLDLFNAGADTVSTLHSDGKKVICYFSAGTSEQGRPDLGGLPQSDYGAALPDWPGENYIDIRSDSVWKVMKGRIDQAAEKGCDAVDPDNMDGYSNNNGLGLTQQDSTNFQNKMGDYAHSLGMAIGLKNAEDILGSVNVDFAVNEQCLETGRCTWYDNLLAAGKPVYHIEYTDDGSNRQTSDYCLQGTAEASKFDTVIKHLALDGWVRYCDGKEFTTATSGKRE